MPSGASIGSARDCASTPGLAPTVAVIGGGQLARMMAEPAAALGIPLRLLAEAPGVSAAQVIPDHVVGDYTDLATLREVTAGCEVVTFDHEHVPTDHLHALEADPRRTPGTGRARARPGQGRDAARLAALGVPCPRNALVVLGRGRRRSACPCVLKTTRGGYDGKGVWFVADEPSDCAAAFESGSADPRRGAGRLPPRALRPRRPVAVRTGRRVAGGRLHPARRHLPRGDRARLPTWTPTSPSRPSRSRCGSRASWASPACWPSSCSRPATGGSWSTSSRCARTTPVTGPRTAR